jgi:hypothetical protein
MFDLLWHCLLHRTAALTEHSLTLGVITKQKAPAAGDADDGGRPRRHHMIRTVSITHSKIGERKKAQFETLYMEPWLLNLLPNFQA